MATGVAVLLSWQKFAVEPTTRYPVRLVAFDMEEYGLLGSTEYAAQLRQQQQPLRLMISLDASYCNSTLVHNATHLVWNASTPIVVIYWFNWQLANDS